MRISVLFVVVLILSVWTTTRIDAHAVGKSVSESSAAADAHHLRVWTNVQTNTTYRATFLLLHKDEVFLEDAAGKVIAVPFAHLSVTDRAIADEHRERIRILNRSNEYTPSLQPSRQPPIVSVWSQSSVMALVVALALALGAGLYLGASMLASLTANKRKRLNFRERLNLRDGIITAAATLALVVALIESNILPTNLIAQTLNVYSKGIAYPVPASALRSVKFDNNNIVISSTLSSTPLSFSLSAADSIKIINTTTDPALMNLAFAPYKSTVTTSWDDTYFYAASNGIPAHNMMVGITAWIAQVPIPHPYTGTNKWSIPLKPEYAASPLSIRTNFMRGAIAIAVNGLPIFNALNASGEDSKAKGELDQWGGHCGRADDYHYHVAPLQFEATSGLQPIAFALDGFAVYGSKEPDGSAMTTLDQYHGHVGTNGVYHYHGTTTSPYMIEAMRGKVSLDPRSTAPENQITPQAMTTPLRMTPHPINPSSTITALTAHSAGNGYLLEYTTAGKKGSVSYTWTGTGLTGLYTFTFTDVDGKVSVETFQR